MKYNSMSAVEVYWNIFYVYKDRATQVLCVTLNRLRVVSNFGDGDCGAGEIHKRVRAKFREDATRGERQKLETTDLAREFDLSRLSDFEV